MTEDWLKVVADGEQPTAEPLIGILAILADIALSQRAIATADRERVAILKTALDDLETRVLTLEANDAAARRNV